MNSFEAAEELSNVCFHVYEGFCLGYFLRAFLAPRGRKGQGVYLPPAVWTAACVSGWLVSSGSGVDLVLKQLWILLVLFVFLRCCYQGRAGVQLVVAIWFTAIRELVFFIAYSASGLGNVLTAHIAQRVLTAPERAERILLEIRLVSLGSVLLVELLTAVLLTWFCRQYVHSRRHPITDSRGRERLYYLLTPASATLVVSMVRLTIFSMEGGQNVSLYEQHPTLYALVPMIAAVLLAAILYSFRLYQEMMDLQQAKSERIIMERQIEQMQESMTELERYYSGLRAVRHDLSNQMAVLEELLHGGDEREAARFLGDLQSSLSGLERSVRTGNAVSDAVLDNKFRRARETLPGIRLEAEDFLLTETVGVRPYDIGIILNNGLDNAIEACRKLRAREPETELFITVRSFWKRKLFFIEIENSFDGAVRFDEESGLPVSSKDDTELHGFGLKNIQSCAQRYAGGVDCIVEEDRFILSVMLKIGMEKQ